MKYILLILLLLLAACKSTDTPTPDMTQTPFIVTTTPESTTRPTDTPEPTPTPEIISEETVISNGLIASVYIGTAANDPYNNGSIAIPMPPELWGFTTYDKDDNGKPFYPSSEFILSDDDDGAITWSLASFGGEAGTEFSESYACYTYDRIFYADGRYAFLIRASVELPTFFPGASFGGNTIGTFLRGHRDDSVSFQTTIQWFTSQNTEQEFQWVVDFTQDRYILMEYCFIVPYAVIRVGTLHINDLFAVKVSDAYGESGVMIQAVPE